MLKKLRISAFDFLKKRNMEREYLRDTIWARNESTSDIHAALTLVAGAHYRRCLDAGTGLGHYAEGAAKFCDAVVAIDISERAINRARKRLADVPNLVFKVGNIRTLRAEKFDLIILGDVLYYLGDTRFPEEFKDILRTLVGMLNPGGKILLSNFISPDRPEPMLRNYSETLVSLGLALEQSSVFTDGRKSWLQTVLTAPSSIVSAL